MAFAVIMPFHTKIIVLPQSVIVHFCFFLEMTSLTMSLDTLKNRCCKKNSHLYNTHYIKMVKS